MNLIQQPFLLSLNVSNIISVYSSVGDTDMKMRERSTISSNNDLYNENYKYNYHNNYNKDE